MTYIVTTYYMSDRLEGLILIPLDNEFIRLISKDYSILKDPDINSVNVSFNSIKMSSKFDFIDKKELEKIRYGNEDYILLSNINFDEDISELPCLRIYNKNSKFIELNVYDSFEIGTAESTYLNLEIEEMMMWSEAGKMGLI
jgi:hypothetical protein